jgi:hypothetical protein
MGALVAYVVTLLPAPDRDGIRDLRFVLKIVKRHLHLRALDVREQTICRRDARRRAVKQTQRRNGDIPMTNLRKYGPTNKWIKLGDVHGKPSIVERIGLVKIEKGKFGEQTVLVLEPSGRMVGLNVTSAGNLLRDFGENDDDWLGKLVEVYAGTVPTKSGDMDAALVRAAEESADAATVAKAVKAAKAKAKAKAGGGGDMDDQIPFMPDRRG